MPEPDQNVPPPSPPPGPLEPIAGPPEAGPPDGVPPAAPAAPAPPSEGGQPTAAAGGEGEAPAEPAAEQPAAVKDTAREVVETVVFVVVLVLLLKTWAAEAFVIPTGSMATTLYGDQKIVTCPRCGHTFPVNCSNEANPRHGSPSVMVEGCTCPNCEYRINFQQDHVQASCNSGDRVLVAKFLYDTPFRKPARHEVVVFKYPKEPEPDYQPMNYIKRLVGYPGETIGIHGGDLFVYPPPGGTAALPLTYADQPRPPNPVDSWKKEFTYEDYGPAQDLFRAGDFAIVRKPPHVVLAMRREVYNNDEQATDLLQAGAPPRWAAESDPEQATHGASDTPEYLRRRHAAEQVGAWAAEQGERHGFHHPARAGALDWLRYRHLVIDRSAFDPIDPNADTPRPRLITDLLGYDTGFPALGNKSGENWVGDLLLECEVTCAAPAAGSSQQQFVLELSRGKDRFQARWDLASGDCSLVRITADREVELQRRPTGLRGGGTHHVRFANVDEQLIVWVDGRLPFGDAATSYTVPYDLPLTERGPERNDLEPASIGVRGADVSVRHLQLWRDTYYTRNVSESADAHLEQKDDWSDPSKWDPLRELRVKTLYVQPGNYLCLGDNSTNSSDGRDWGLVPERLLLGRALVIYYPLSRIRPIR